MPKQITTKYTLFKEHKGTIRYQALSSLDAEGKVVDPNPIRDIYVDRGALGTYRNVSLTLHIS
jgi:hypothetical protein